jgi:hypothetical protein
MGGFEEDCREKLLSWLVHAIEWLLTSTLKGSIQSQFSLCPDPISCDKISNGEGPYAKGREEIEPITRSVESLRYCMRMTSFVMIG